MESIFANCTHQSDTGQRKSAHYGGAEGDTARPTRVCVAVCLRVGRRGSPPTKPRRAVAVNLTAPEDGDKVVCAGSVDHGRGSGHQRIYQATRQVGKRKL
ncbi:unnamed protein product, partial [Iphiclides podalirius]